MRFHRSVLRSLAPLAFGLAVWLVWPAQALARAVVRFIHGVPGVGKATVELNPGNGNVDLGSIGFAQSTQWHSIRSGSFEWTLVGGGKPLATGTATVGDGAYDIVVLEKSMKVWLGIYRARGGKPGTSLVRVIHGAPELGSPELTIDGKEAVKSLGYTQATPYVSINPGTHSLGAMRPGDSTPLVTAAGIHLVTGVSYSAIVLGTRGQRVRVVALTDRGAPLTRPGAVKPKPHPAAAPESRSTSVVVRHGDSLWAIASRLLGPGAGNEAIEHKLVAIWDLNAQRIGTGDPNLIFPGTRLSLP
jgi:Domain of unknown function (DUF4397)/LysM domain